MTARVINRRDFLRLTSSAAAALGLSQLGLTQKLFAASKKPAVIWLEGQDCTGCTESVLSSLSPDVRDILLNTLCVKYHETIMAGTGTVAESALQSAISAGGYVLIVEGSIPSTDKRYLYVADKPFEDTFIAAASNATVILALGACASFGGIPKAGPSGGESVKYFLNKYGISKPYINLPGCPTHPTWFFDTVIAYLNGITIALDSNNRPTNHYGTLIHKQCTRTKNRFLTDWNSTTQQNYCLSKKGCKGKYTYASCPSLKWNDGVNWCIGNNAPCAGCTQPEFYSGFSPLYKI
jgi:hydrogenase small subunit